MHSSWTTKEGLPSDSINDIIQDRTGYIWIGTFNGLVRFDGIDFFTFSKYEKHGFESNSVTSLIEDVDGAIWIGTNGEGISRYINNKFTMFNNKILKNKVIKSLSIDRSGLLWIGTGNGLLVSDKRGSISIPLKGKYNEQNIELVYHDPDGQMWISTESGGISVFFNGILKNLPVLEKLKGNVVTAVMKDREKNIWIGTKNQSLFLIKKGVLSNFKDQRGFNANTITSIRQGKHGCVWISTDSGFFRYTENKLHHYSEKNGLSDNQVSKILEDKEGSIWIATSRGGINKLSDGKFVSLTSLQGLINDKVNSIFQDGKNTFWIGTDGGLSIISDGKFVRSNITRYLRGVRIRHINKDSTGRMWISTYSDFGMVTYHKDKIIKFTARDGLSSNRCRVSIEDSAKNIWIGTPNGLNMIGSGSEIRTFTKKNGLSDNYILSLFEDSEQKLWITTNGGGISVLSRGRFSTLKARDGLPSNIVFRVHEDRDKIFWISTSGGLSRYDGKSFFNYSKSNGLPDNAVFQVLEDGKGRMWLTAEQGIYIASKKSLNRIAKERSGSIKVTLYNNLDGLLDSPTPVSWAITTNEGKNMFSTLMGVATIDTLNIPINEKPPSLLIEMIRVDNRSYSPAQIKLLSPNYKRLTFAYTALSYVIPHKVQYKYKLEGFDEEWSGLTTTREVSYTTLPPGNYVFKVKAVNNDGVWNVGNVQIPFSQKPFFYQTLWFYIAIILSLIGIIALVLGLRIINLRKRSDELEKQVAERTAELRTTDRIVANINKEIKIGKLLKVLLQQTMILFPQAEKGVIFTYDKSTKKFVHQISRGYEDITTSGICLSFEEAVNRYVEKGREFEEGIYVHREFTSKADRVISKADIPESMIAMTITFGDTIDGFFILENMTDSEAFTETDAKKLMRVREHAISAVFKARTHQKLEEAAIKDPLTGLHNRRKMIEVLETELVRAERTKQPFCIVMCDIDHFKKFNDTYGHDCGDYVLVEISRLIRSTIRKQDFVGRWGGEEFLLLYPETSLDGGKTVAEKVRSVIDNTIFIYKGAALKITMTFGVAIHSGNKSIDDVINEADDALYEGKKGGRNRVVCK
ncbi:MAG: two-component regulator propeller domain-containing protein [Acidobacteriota bacterium]